MNVSEAGINLLKCLEGCVKIGNKHVIYDDKTGRPVADGDMLPNGATIGYGHLIKKGENFNGGISENAAAELLCQDLETAEHAVQHNVIVTLSQNQYDALVIFAYNIGAKNFAKSTVVKYINNPEFYSSIYSTLKSAWMAWDKIGNCVNVGLHNRRNKEWNLFSMGVY